MNIPELEYIANHLTSKECRRLVASLHFEPSDVPALFEQKVPEDVACIKLLIKWNNGQENWEGKGKTHEDVARKLRAIGRRDVADWLGATVFHRLALDLDDALLNSFQTANTNEDTNNLLSDVDTVEKRNEWIVLDSILSVVLVGIVGTILVTCWNILVLSFTRTKESIIDDEEATNFISHEIEEERDSEDEKSVSKSVR